MYSIYLHFKLFRLTKLTLVFGWLLMAAVILYSFQNVLVDIIKHNKDAKLPTVSSQSAHKCSAPVKKIGYLKIHKTAST